MTYIKNPDEITKQSFAIIDRESDLHTLPEEIRFVARRMIHTCGMLKLTNYLCYSEGAVVAGRSALDKGAHILTDVTMVAAGINQSRLNSSNKVICTIGEKKVTEISQKLSITRSAAAIDLWKPLLKGSIVAIGNAPTALFHLLEIIESERLKPALIIATPPGFVGAKESKDALINNNLSIPFIAIKGRIGGSALAAAAINALSREEQ